MHNIQFFQRIKNEEYAKIAASKWFAFAIILVIVFIWVLLQQDLSEYYDARVYLFGGLPMFEHGVSLTAFDVSFRGYFLPFVNAFILKVAELSNVEGVVLFRLVNSLFMTYVLVIVIPDFIEALFPVKLWFSRYFFFGVVFLFWNGYFLHALSDFPSLFVLLIALMTVLRSLKTGGVQRFLLLGLSGFCLGAALNIRPSYQVVPVFFILYFVLVHVRRDVPYPHIALRLMAIFVGAFVVLLPQMVINHAHANTWSPLVQTEKHFNGSSLYVLQLNWGIILQKYETNVGSEYPTPQVSYSDPLGQNVLAHASVSAGAMDLKQYLRLVKNNPFSFMVIYLKHIFNGLDVIQTTPYQTKVPGDTIYIRVINYTIWFFVLLAVLSAKGIQKILQPEFLLLILTIISPTLLTIPASVEVRFYLPLSLMAYCVFCFYSIHNLRQYFTKSVWLQTAILYVAFLLMMGALSASTYLNLTNVQWIFPPY